jgi:hypothetical protein
MQEPSSFLMCSVDPVSVAWYLRTSPGKAMSFWLFALSTS